jgi:hypothetical protein
MAFDPTLPETPTAFSVLCETLRNQLNALNDLFTLEAWKNVSSLGANWSAVYTISYMKDSMGFVHLKGYAQCSGTGATTLFTLDSNYRPEQYSVFISSSDNSYANISTIIITTAGAVNSSSILTGSFAFLDGITFKAATA